jgi:hypothetical protein
MLDIVREQNSQRNGDDKPFSLDQTPGLMEPSQLATGSRSAVDDAIKVGNGGLLVVPHEDIDAGIDEGTVLTSPSDQISVRRPDPHEWFSLRPDLQLRTRLLVVKSQTRYEFSYYYVDPTLREPIEREIRSVRVFPFYSHLKHRFDLWVVRVTQGNSWYESIDQVLAKPREFFEQQAIRMTSDVDSGIYRFRAKALTFSAQWPENTGKLLGAALGEDGHIKASSHEVYRQFTEGVEVL